MDALKIQSYYQKGLSYFASMGFNTKWKECVDFKSGKQWAPATERTKNFPRPVVNIIRYIENHKCSQIIGDPIKMVFSLEEEIEESSMFNLSDTFTQFASQEWEEINQDELNEDCLDTASNIGSGIFHYYYDDSIVYGQTVKYKGRLKGEMINPINVFVGNPQELSTQKQPYILITQRMDLKSVKNMAKLNGLSEEDIDKIATDMDTSNESTNTNSTYEINKKTTVITAYWKKDNTIWFTKIAGEVVLKEPVDTEHKLYPIARFNWNKEDKNWYGQGDTVGLIANQKAINYMTALQMKSEELTGMPKLMLKQGYISNFNNDVSVPLYDNNPNGWSAQYLQPSYQSNRGQTLIDFLLTQTKVSSGSTETATGELTKTSQMNATAIMLLQKASQVPIESIKKRFHRVHKEIGDIWLEFWTINYNTERMIKVKDGQSNEVLIPFRGSDFKDIGLKLKISIGTSTDYSEPLVMSTLDKLLDKGMIQLKTYVELAPQSVIPFKAELLKTIENSPQMSMPNIQGQQPTPDMMQQLMQGGGNNG